MANCIKLNVFNTSNRIIPMPTSLNQPLITYPSISSIISKNGPFYNWNSNTLKKVINFIINI